MRSPLNYDNDGFYHIPSWPLVEDRHWLAAIPPEDHTGFAEAPHLIERIEMPDAYLAINALADRVFEGSHYRNF